MHANITRHLPAMNDTDKTSRDTPHNCFDDADMLLVDEKGSIASSIDPRVLDKTDLKVPLSVCTAEPGNIPIRDVASWVTRAPSIRRREVEQIHGYAKRPLNYFMLY